MDVAWKAISTTVVCQVEYIGLCVLTMIYIGLSIYSMHVVYT